jgi:hypothetical protein
MNLTPPSSSGSDRIRLPVSADTAFAIAGATSGTPTSPIPPGFPPLGIRITSVRGGIDEILVELDSTSFSLQLSATTRVISELPAQFAVSSRRSRPTDGGPRPIAVILPDAPRAHPRREPC